MQKESIKKQQLSKQDAKEGGEYCVERARDRAKQTAGLEKQVQQSSVEQRILLLEERLKCQKQKSTKNIHAQKEVLKQLKENKQSNSLVLEQNNKQQVSGVQPPKRLCYQAGLRDHNKKRFYEIPHQHPSGQLKVSDDWLTVESSALSVDEPDLQARAEASTDHRKRISKLMKVQQQFSKVSSAQVVEPVLPMPVVHVSPPSSTSKHIVSSVLPGSRMSVREKVPQPTSTKTGSTDIPVVLLTVKDLLTGEEKTFLERIKDMEPENSSLPSISEKSLNKDTTQIAVDASTSSCERIKHSNQKEVEQPQAATLDITNKKRQFPLEMDEELSRKKIKIKALVDPLSDSAQIYEMDTIEVKEENLSISDNIKVEEEFDTEMEHDGIESGVKENIFVADGEMKEEHNYDSDNIDIVDEKPDISDELIDVQDIELHFRIPGLRQWLEANDYDIGTMIKIEAAHRTDIQNHSDDCEEFPNTVPKALVKTEEVEQQESSRNMSTQTDYGLLMDLNAQMFSGKNLPAMCNVSSEILDLLVQLMNERYPIEGETLVSTRDRIIITLCRLTTGSTITNLHFMNYPHLNTATIKEIFLDTLKKLSQILEAIVTRVPDGEKQRKWYEKSKNISVLDSWEIRLSKATCEKCHFHVYYHYMRDYVIIITTADEPEGVTVTMNGFFLDVPVNSDAEFDSDVEPDMSGPKPPEVKKDDIMPDRHFFISTESLRNGLQFKKNKTNAVAKRAAPFNKKEIDKMIKKIRNFKVFQYDYPWHFVDNIDQVFIVCCGLAILQTSAV